MNHARANHLMEAYDGELYVFGGSIKHPSGGPSFVSTIEMYDIISEQWTIIKGPSLSVTNSFSVIKDKNILIFGGQKPPDETTIFIRSNKTIEAFDINEQKVVPYLKELANVALDHVSGMFILPQVQ